MPRNQSVKPVGLKDFRSGWRAQRSRTIYSVNGRLPHGMVITVHIRKGSDRALDPDYGLESRKSCFSILYRLITLKKIETDFVEEKTMVLK